MIDLTALKKIQRAYFNQVPLGVNTTYERISYGMAFIFLRDCYPDIRPCLSPDCGVLYSVKQFGDHCPLSHKDDDFQIKIRASWQGVREEGISV